MKYWTYTEIKDKVRRDLGLEQEEFVTNPELMGYVNDAIDEAEAEIITIYEDYFLKPTRMDIVSGQSDYSLPTDIYANKVRAVIYKNGTDMYPIKKVYNKRNMFEHLESLEDEAGQAYRYILINNDADNKPFIRVVPTPDENVTEGLRLWYTRNANRIESNSGIVDIPEFANFIIQYCKVRCYEKEGHPNYQNAVDKLEFYRAQMVETLSDMIPDGDNEVDPDTSFYEEMS